MRRTGIIIGGVIIGLVILGAFAINMYNKPHLDVMNTEIAYSLMADEIMEQFRTNKQYASEKYNGEVISISGDLKDLSNASNGLNYIILSGNSGLINCEMEELKQGFEIEQFRNKPVIIKGICIGYDDLLGELQLKKCTIIGP